MVTKLLPLQAFVSGWRVKRPKWQLKYPIGRVDFFCFHFAFLMVCFIFASQNNRPYDGYL